MQLIHMQFILHAFPMQASTRHSHMTLSINIQNTCNILTHSYYACSILCMQYTLSILNVGYQQARPRTTATTTTTAGNMQQQQQPRRRRRRRRQQQQLRAICGSDSSSSSSSSSSNSEGNMQSSAQRREQQDDPQQRPHVTA